MSNRDHASMKKTEDAGCASPPTPGRHAWSAVFPEAIGVALVLTLIVGVAGVGLAAHFAMERQLSATCESEARAIANLAAAALGPLVEADDQTAATLIQHLCAKTPAIRTVEWRAPDGKTRCRWPVVSSPNPPPVSSDLESQTHEVPVQSISGTPAGLVRIVFVQNPPLEAWTWLMRGSAGAAIVVLLLYYVVYRRLRKHLRPMEAIQRNLEDYAAGVEKEFVALTLSDSLGHVARAWNYLIDQLNAPRARQAEADAGDLSGDALRRFESRTLRSTLDRLPVGLLRFGSDLSVTYANVAAARLLGKNLEQLPGASIANVLEEEVRAPLVGAYLRGGSSMSIDRKRGEEEQQTTVRFSMIPADASSPEREALLTIEDVSHLQEAERARDNFLYHVTHELRTPLTNIQAYAETLTGPGFDDEETRRECYNVIISETRRLSRLVEDILNVSQLEVGTARIEMSEIDLVRLLRQIVQDHLGAADEKRIDLTLKMAPKVPKVQGDKQRLSVLFTNLIGNALKYTPEGGRVDVALDVGERCLEISVADTGIGISKEDQAHVFEKFYRAVSEEVQMIKGTGLGLAIAREVARLHGGDIHLRSELRKGSIFKVELPYGGTTS